MIFFCASGVDAQAGLRAQARRARGRGATRLPWHISVYRWRPDSGGEKHGPGTRAGFDQPGGSGRGRRFCRICLHWRAMSHRRHAWVRAAGGRAWWCLQGAWRAGEHAAMPAMRSRRWAHCHFLKKYTFRLNYANFPARCLEKMTKFNTQKTKISSAGQAGTRTAASEWAAAPGARWPAPWQSSKAAAAVVLEPTAVHRQPPLCPQVFMWFYREYYEC